jgi:hypothetical protein
VETWNDSLLRLISHGARAAAIVAGIALLPACASDPNEPGTESWYVNRIKEIEDSKASGQISQSEYLSLKNQADATRSQRLNAIRNNNADDFWW